MTTLQELEAAVKLLNQNSKAKYRLDGAYGGWRLIQMVKCRDSDPDSDYYGCVKDLGYRGSKSEVYYTVCTILNYLSAEAHEK